MIDRQRGFRYQASTVILLALIWLGALEGPQRTLVGQEASAEDSRPNIVLIMVDDMGFSDLGCYGGEIDTPNLDQLAKQGLRFTQFYNCAKCETTRATLLSGLYYPEVNNRQLDHCMTLAELMKSGGYSTIMTGKWHLKSEPVQRGFEHYFGHLSGATNFFRGDDTFRLYERPFEVPEEGFYTTDADTDYAMEFLDKVDRDSPFFLYVAYNAPHYPLQCPRAEFEKYRDRYRRGWDELRKARWQRQKELGIVESSHGLSPRPDNVPAWDSLSNKEREAQELMMAAYAGMIDRVDQNIGRLVEKLKDLNAYENTLIMFLSDNGACPFQRTRPETREKMLMPYNPESYWTYDRGWAHACNTPFREYKQNQHEGGICTPMIAHWPAKLKQPGRITQQPGHLIDILATCVDLGGIDVPDEFNGEPIKQPRGLSLRPIFQGKTRQSHEYLFFSFYGKNNALRAGDWKIVNKNFQPFELYNLSKDRIESENLRERRPGQFQRMKERMKSVFKRVGQEIKRPDD